MASGLAGVNSFRSQGLSRPNVAFFQPTYSRGQTPMDDMRLSLIRCWLSRLSHGRQLRISALEPSVPSVVATTVPSSLCPRLWCHQVIGLSTLPAIYHLATRIISRNVIWHTRRNLQGGHVTVHVRAASFFPILIPLLGRTSTVAQSPFKPPLTCERHWAVPERCGCSHGTTLRCGCRPALHATWHAAEATSRVARLATGCTPCHAMLCCTSCCKLYATWL